MVRGNGYLTDSLFHDAFEGAHHGMFAELKTRADDAAGDLVRVDIGIQHVPPREAGKF